MVVDHTVEGTLYPLRLSLSRSLPLPLFTFTFTVARLPVEFLLTCTNAPLLRLVMNKGKEIFVSQRGKNLLGTTGGPVLVFSGKGDLLRSFGNDTVTFKGGAWGSHGLGIQFPPSGSHSPATPRLWIYDMIVGSVLVHSARTGELLMRGGTGQPGSDVSPFLQYGNVADGDFDDTRNIAYVADGDGGVNNRVVALDASKRINDPSALLWIAGNNASSGSPPDPHFSSPHSVCFHARTRSLFVADREMNRTQILSAETGAVLGEWTCPELGIEGKAWGVRSSFVKDDLVSSTSFFFLFFL